jgi:hypothetical protein
VPSCLFLPPPICDTGMCVEDPATCRNDEDCRICLHTSAPTSPEECECPTCGAPLTVTQCQANEDAVATHCEGRLDDCIPPPCPFPPPVECTFGTFRCEYGEEISP